MELKILFMFMLVLMFLFTFHIKQNQDIDRIYQQWKHQYGIKSFPNEDLYRKFIFFKNYELILQHNQQANITHLLGINQFTHLAPLQFQSLYSNKFYISTNHDIYNEKINKKFSTNLGDIDWKALGKVSNVTNQGSCDAGYAFCTTSLFESSLLMQDKNITLSQQQMIDCGDKYQMNGCSGGSRLGAINYINDKGLCSNATYPYTGKKETCKKQTGDNKFNLKIIQANGCDELRNKLYSSPITVAVNTQNWQFYRTGIFKNCGQTVNHDIYLVGVSQTYWKLKNSWGLRWGQFGYIRLDIGNTCGICSKTGYGFVL